MNLLFASRNHREKLGGIQKIRAVMGFDEIPYGRAGSGAAAASSGHRGGGGCPRSDWLGRHRDDTFQCLLGSCLNILVFQIMEHFL